MVYQPTVPAVSLPDTDLYSFIFSPNEFIAGKNPNAPILIDGHDGKTLSWEQVRTESSHLASGWNDKVGLNKGDVVAVFAPNQVDHTLLFLSLLAAQVTISPG
jgi:acyl-CoA synthetase (AMP-forming)/AMP-acid ligase II